ncbi:MAG TPA: hypothetical protein VGI60_10080 [Chthoniobacterales bacterium]|jgi:hypothetical protein
MLKVARISTSQQRNSELPSLHPPMHLTGTSALAQRIAETASGANFQFNDLINEER